MQYYIIQIKYKVKKWYDIIMTSFVIYKPYL